MNEAIVEKLVSIMYYGDVEVTTKDGKKIRGTPISNTIKKADSKTVTGTLTLSAGEGAEEKTIDVSEITDIVVYE
jgi:hypothetical protein